MSEAAPTKTFADLGLVDYLIRALSALGFDTPTPIQTQAIPLVAAGRDVIAEAQTGSGKTAAFALPILQNLGDAEHGVRVLVLAPTRELALQVAASFEKLARYSPAIQVLGIIGGEPIREQIAILESGIDIVVATPGRLLDLIENNHITLSGVQTLVLDEADRLLDVGFLASLNSLLDALPEDRQTLLFSATLPPAVLDLCERLQRDPVTVRIDAVATPVKAIDQRVYQVNRDRRRQLLQHLAAAEKWKRTLVFVATQRSCENLVRKLSTDGVSAIALHGGLDQTERITALARFKNGRVSMLIATDLAARGIDIPLLDTVVNFDLPRSPRDYTHRIGRTGRAGATGIAVSFVDHDAEAHFRLIEKQTGCRLPRQKEDGFLLTGAPPQRSKGKAAVKGKRRSKKDKLRAAAARKLRRDHPTGEQDRTGEVVANEEPEQVIGDE